MPPVLSKPIPPNPRSKPKNNKNSLPVEKPANSIDKDSAPVHSSSEDSDNTIVQSEIRKLSVPDDLIEASQYDFDRGSSSSGEFDELTSTNKSTGNLGDDEKSDTKSPSEPRSPAPQTQLLFNSQSTQAQSRPFTSKHVDVEPPIPSSQVVAEAAQSSEIDAVQYLAHPDVDIRSVPAHVREMIEMDLLNRIDHTAKLKKALDKEIRNRKKLAKSRAVSGQQHSHEPSTSQSVSQSEEPGATAPQSSVVPFHNKTSDQAKKSSVPTFKIPRLSPLEMSVIKKAVTRVAKRRRLSNSYSVLSEILAVKQVLAKGNPFVVIPQHAYNIANVPGIRLPHIQQLLQQWQTYFSNMIYQIVQIEYSLEYADVERRINLMVEGGESFEALCQFQALIGKDEINSSNFKPKMANITELPSSDPTKKARILENVSTTPPTLTDNSNKKQCQPLLQ